MGFTLSEVFACDPDEDALRLIREFASMVKWWAERAGGFRGKSYGALRKENYRAWVERWPNHHSQLLHTSAITAYSLLKLSKKPEDRPKSVNLNLPYAVLHPKMLMLEGDRVRISVMRGGYAYVKLLPNSLHQKRLLQQAEAGFWRLGQAILTRSWIAISFTVDKLDEATLKRVEKMSKPT